jgi:hypothetical protein
MSQVSLGATQGGRLSYLTVPGPLKILTKVDGTQEAENVLTEKNKFTGVLHLPAIKPVTQAGDER